MLLLLSQVIVWQIYDNIHVNCPFWKWNHPLLDIKFNVFLNWKLFWKWKSLAFENQICHLKKKEMFHFGIWNHPLLKKKWPSFKNVTLNSVMKFAIFPFKKNEISHQNWPLLECFQAPLEMKSPAFKNYVFSFELKQNNIIHKAMWVFLLKH